MRVECSLGSVSINDSENFIIDFYSVVVNNALNGLSITPRFGIKHIVAADGLCIIWRIVDFVKSIQRGKICYLDYFDNRHAIYDSEEDALCVLQKLNEGNECGVS